MKELKMILMVLMCLTESVMQIRYIKFRLAEPNKTCIFKSNEPQKSRLMFDLIFLSCGISTILFVIISIYMQSIEYTYSLIVPINLIVLTAYTTFGSRIGLIITEDELNFMLNSIKWDQIERYEWKLSVNTLWLHIYNKKRLLFKVEINRRQKEALEYILEEHLINSKINLLQSQTTQ